MTTDELQAEEVLAMERQSLALCAIGFVLIGAVAEWRLIGKR